MGNHSTLTVSGWSMLNRVITCALSPKINLLITCGLDATLTDNARARVLSFDIHRK